MTGTEDLRPDLRIATGHVNTLVRLYRIGAVTCAAVVAARATGTNEIGSLSVDLPLSFIWIGLTAATFIHWQLARVASESFNDVIDTEYRRSGKDPHVTGEALFQEIRSQDTVFLRGILRRAPTPGGRLYRMHWRDPTSAVFVSLCFLFFLAILPWSYSDGNVAWTAGLAGIVGLISLGTWLVYFNWLAGGSWMIALSQLRLPLSEAPDLHTDQGLSGFLFEPFGWSVFFFAIALLVSGLLWLVIALF